MKAISTGIRVSASDLSNHLACRHLTVLDLQVADHRRPPPTWNSPDAWVLQQRGIEHENAYVQHLESQGLSVVDLKDVLNDSEAVSDTAMALRNGSDVIIQGNLAGDNWFGRPDVLRRVERSSNLGGWSYEVYDTKLARETKAGTILQLSLYSDLLEAVQGITPESMYVVPPGETYLPERYRVLDYAAYYRYVKSRLETAVRDNGSSSISYPEPNPHCEVCRWRLDCDVVRRQDDHLSLVAGISRLQRKQLQLWYIQTVAELARLPLPIQHRPEYGSKEGYARVREQARIQVAGREQNRPLYEVLEITAEHGLSLLPEPSPGDLFFDLEGDPFVGLTGREYLFGLVLMNSTGAPNYEFRWGVDATAEREAFHWFVDIVMNRWERYPSMHIYHFAPYEPSALKRLMGRHNVCVDEIDQMLRAKLFVDLHTVLKRSVRASVEQYTLKAIEVFHGFTRNIPLDDAGQAMRQMQHGLELSLPTEVSESVREAIVLYNADDCFSTLSLRSWLEQVRLEQESAGCLLARPLPSDGAPSETLTDRQLQTAILAKALTGNLPVDANMRHEEESARWLLANLLDWHRREAKADWWEYFRLKDLTDDDLLDERCAISGLELVGTIETIRGIPTDRYTFARQETAVCAGDKVLNHDGEIGKVVFIDTAMRTVDIKKMRKTATVHPQSIFPDPRGPNTDILADSLFRLGSWVDSNGLDSPGSYRAARDLLLRRPPRLLNGSGLAISAEESTLHGARRIVVQLGESVFALQGPPGAGKTYTGARMICELVRQGKKVGVTAVSHKVARKLLEEVIKAAIESDLNHLRCVQKVGEHEEEIPGIVAMTDNARPLAALHDGVHVVAGTAWLWSRPEYFEAVDVLFVDEAGQMSLANVLAISQAAKSLVLLGDPQQLEQPLKGSHPDGAEVSALEHLLDGEKTILPDKGLFLDKTWRLHPRICEFTSEVFYEGRLHSHEGLEIQRIAGHPWLSESNLWFIPVVHEGNQNTAPEEVEYIAHIVDSLLQPNVTWVDEKGFVRPLGSDDILIVAPYNAQVSDLSLQMPHARIGTVDKFQGQQAPIVIYSLTTSSPEDAPRGMEFLYSLNRLNVATSRAQAMVIVVGSTLLLEPECRSPRQMQLANALCRYMEMASIAEARLIGRPNC
jgi:predicted RecB family nuclease